MIFFYEIINDKYLWLIKFAIQNHNLDRNYNYKILEMR